MIVAAVLCRWSRAMGGLRSRHEPPAARPFDREHLPLAEPWFTDAGTQRWLGGPGWARLMPGRAGRPLGEFRGAAETGRYRWLAWDRGTAVGYIDCGTYDRWATWEGGAPAGAGSPA